jgi:hypothetical protein
MRSKHRVTLVGVIVAWSLLLSTLTACVAGNTPALQDRIREYLYKYQPTTGQQFVLWANRELATYTAREVFGTLQAEGKLQAQLGHPNVVGVLSFCASAWAQHKGLITYRADEWLALQEEAKVNLRDEPGTLQLWPTESK